jgi:hypothetical protein
MHTALTPRLVRSIIGASLLLAVVAPSALAKEGVEVALSAPISADAQPGDTVDVFFTLATISDTGASPLSGSDVFLRLYGPKGARTEAAGVGQARAGTYKATIEIPAGGAARAEFGLNGAVKNAAGKVIASDIVWPYDGILVAAAVPAPVKPQIDPAAGTKPATGAQPAVGEEPASGAQPATAPGPAVDLRLAAAVGLALGLALIAARMLGRRRRMHGSPA